MINFYAEYLSVYSIGLSDSQIMLNLSPSVGLEDDQYFFSGGWVELICISDIYLLT